MFLILKKHLFQLACRKLPVFISNPYVCPAICKIRGIISFEFHNNTILSFNFLFLNLWIYFWLNILRNCPRNLSQAIFSYSLPGNLAAITDSKIKLPFLMLVKH